MTLRRKVTTALLAGAVATSVIAPTSVFAASQGDVTVQYIAGALVPDGSDGTYYITIPANVVFSGVNDSHDMSVNLKNVDPTKDLDENLEVQVDVYSANNYSLKNTSYAGVTGTYELIYTGANADNNGNKLVNTTPAGPASATAGDVVGTLTPDASVISGTATLKTEPSVEAKGVPFTDTLTYYVTETAATGN